MPELVIVTDTPGNEAIACGGLIARYKTLTQGKIKDEEKPFVIFTTVADYEDKDRFISKQEQLNEINKASKILGFNWEVLYKGRKYKNKLALEVGIKELVDRIYRSLEFLEPSTIIYPNYSMDFQDNDKMSIDIAINTIRHSKDIVFNQMRSLTYERDPSNLGNQIIELRPNHLDIKRKAILCYKSVLGNDITYPDRIVEYNKRIAKDWGIHYAEAYNFVSGIIY